MAQFDEDYTAFYMNYIPILPETDKDVQRVKDILHKNLMLSQKAFNIDEVEMTKTKEENEEMKNEEE